MAYIIKENECLACEACSDACPFDCISYLPEKNVYHIDEEKCRSCGQCALACIKSIIYPAEGCKPIKSIKIDAAKCKGCSLCARNCVASAISGVLKSPYTINEKLCIRCGVCAEKCKFDAVVAEY